MFASPAAGSKTGRLPDGRPDGGSGRGRGQQSTGRQGSRRRRGARSWAYQEEHVRDRRVDMLRGMAILFVVVNHVGLTSLFQLLVKTKLLFRIITR